MLVQDVPIGSQLTQAEAHLFAQKNGYPSSTWFCLPLINRTLESIGVALEFSGDNDMLVVRSLRKN